MYYKGDCELDSRDGASNALNSKRRLRQLLFARGGK